VGADDAVRVDLVAEDEYAMHLFKQKHHNNTDAIIITWDGQSTLAPSSSTVYLQVYNRNAGVWESVDADGISDADIDFSLGTTVSENLTNYYGTSITKGTTLYWFSWRVYQLEPV